jgi:hypothetical protein
MLVTTGGHDDEQEDDSARQLHRDSSFGPDGAIYLLTCCFFGASWPQVQQD